MKLKTDSLYLDFRNSYKKYHQTTGNYYSYWTAIESLVKNHMYSDGVKVIYVDINRERLDGHKTVYGGQE